MIHADGGWRMKKPDARMHPAGFSIRFLQVRNG
jgi:hypothetical protein